MIESVAGCFAAKEAFGKALGTGMTNFVLKDLSLLHSINGKPRLVVDRTAKRALYSKGADSIFVSLAHEKDYVIAIVILEKYS